ncbi:hypothetical protein FEM48_ZijujUnG0003800 [Ziziphus jujuba var. spinosa]|uniref:Disease resistance protein At4g27190-like leucine-rich repeats domain-containing protein n=1 Tax=Ziziphus jujuba var. spinosa TaxID=714518 RepID=A0A978UA36_ZIZJJ|nr:hypothetical protein FEM48_ZijujUnG0003800 [Ziziphus jujuba var. spinosa]
MQRRLHNLERLEISDCDMVEEVFGIQMTNVEGTYNVIPSESELSHLSLVSLSKLKNVWSKDPQGTLTFPHLKEVAAESCPNLESIFPASVAKGLFQLQTLHISDCGIEYIVGKEERLETCMKLKVIASEFFNVQETHGSVDIDVLYEEFRGRYFDPDIGYYIAKPEAVDG